MGYFKDVTPESAGISSKGILNFLDRIEENQIELHSFMVIRHGQCAAKGWWKPYDEKFRHPLYSFSKSLTATAIGFAEQEGILSLDEKIVDIFPDLLPENPSENLKKITLHHLLIMGCGHETEIMDNSENWISTFLHHPVLHEPGTFYKYNTAGTNMLAAVLRKKTGQNVTEFLKSRLLEPLGITSLTCALLGDGTELGGGGMKMVTEDMAKFTYFLSRQGEWEGKQLLRKDWFERACHKQIETEGDSEGHVKDWAQGYGYQCWMCRYPGSFRADGAYGQFGVVFPDLDLIVILTTATEQTQEELSALQEELIPYVKKEVRRMKESQLLKGVLEGCVLEIISKKSIYGYELIQSLKETGFDKIVAGTVYPLLQKLEKQGVIVGEMRPSPDGRDRKYFSLTMEGRERLEEFWNQWQDLVIKVERVKKEGEAI